MVTREAIVAAARSWRYPEEVSAVASCAVGDATLAELVTKAPAGKPAKNK